MRREVRGEQNSAEFKIPRAESRATTTTTQQNPESAESARALWQEDARAESRIQNPARAESVNRFFTSVSEQNPEFSESGVDVERAEAVVRGARALTYRLTF